MIWRTLAPNEFVTSSNTLGVLSSVAVKVGGVEWVRAHVYLAVRFSDRGSDETHLYAMNWMQAIERDPENQRRPSLSTAAPKWYTFPTNDVQVWASPLVS